MKNYRDFIQHIWTTNTRCWACIFFSIMAMISKFSIIFAFRELFKDVFCTNTTYFYILVWFYSSSVNSNIFVFSKPIIFFACSLKEAQNFFIQSFPRYKVCLFSIWSNLQIVYIEYSQGTCSPIFSVEDSSGLFAHLSIFLLKDSMSASFSLVYKILRAIVRLFVANVFQSSIFYG